MHSSSFALAWRFPRHCAAAAASGAPPRGGHEAKLSHKRMSSKGFLRFRFKDFEFWGVGESVGFGAWGVVGNP